MERKVLFRAYKSKRKQLSRKEKEKKRETKKQLARKEKAVSERPCVGLVAAKRTRVLAASF